MSLIIAHRGASYHAPENTVAAFRKAAQLGANGIETDIQITKDKQLVIHHNYSIDATADGSGQVAEMAVEQLKTFDFGIRKGPEFAGERIPTLDECLDAVKEMELVNLELKAPLDHSIPYVQMVIDCVKAHGMLEQVVLSAFEHDLLRQAKQICPEIRVGALTTPPMGGMAGLFQMIAAVVPAHIPVSEVDVDQVDLSSVVEKVGGMFPNVQSPEANLKEMIHVMGAMYPSQTMQEILDGMTRQNDLYEYVKSLDFKLDYLHPEYHSCLKDETLVSRLAELGVGVSPYTVDKPEDMEKLWDMGCYSIITNRPDLLMEIKKSK